MTTMVRRSDRVRRAVAVIAIAFGALTLLAGGRILLGLGEAGYTVLRPVLAFNTLMGAVYVLVGVAVWRAARWARTAVGVVALTNVAVLAVLVARRVAGGTVADQTLGAMALRAGVWLVLLAALAWEVRRRARMATS